MNTATLESPGSFEVLFRDFDPSAAEALSDSQRRQALEMLRQQTEVEMRRALGDRNFHAFKAFNQWWFRELSAGDQMNGKQAARSSVEGGLNKRLSMMNQTLGPAFHLEMKRTAPNGAGRIAMSCTGFPITTQHADHDYGCID